MITCLPIYSGELVNSVAAENSNDLVLQDFTKLNGKVVKSVDVDALLQLPLKTIELNNTYWGSYEFHYEIGYKLMNKLFEQGSFPSLKKLSLNYPKSVLIVTKIKCIQGNGHLACGPGKEKEYSKLNSLDFSHFAPNLEFISLQGFHFGPIEERSLLENQLQELESLDSLGILDLSYGTFSSENIEQTLYFSLPKLQELNLRGSNIRGAHFDHFSPNLKRLNLENSNVGGRDVKNIAKLNFVEQLNLNSTSITGASIKALAMMPTLKILSLANTNMKKADFSHLQNIEELDLSYAELTLESFNTLSLLTQLKKLDVRYIKGYSISNSDINLLQAILKDCEINK